MERESINLGMLALLGGLLSDGSIARAGTDPKAEEGAAELLLELEGAGYLRLEGDEVRVAPRVRERILAQKSGKSS